MKDGRRILTWSIFVLGFCCAGRPEDASSHVRAEPDKTAGPRLTDQRDVSTWFEGIDCNCNTILLLIITISCQNRHKNVMSLLSLRMLMTGFLRDPEETLEMERDAKFLARRQELMQSALILGHTNSIPTLNLKRGTAAQQQEGLPKAGLLLESLVFNSRVLVERSQGGYVVEKSKAAAADASDANHFCKQQQQQQLQMEHMATDDSGKMSTNSGFSVKQGVCLTPFCFRTKRLLISISLALPLCHLSSAVAPEFVLILNTGCAWIARHLIIANFLWGSLSYLVMDMWKLLVWGF